MTRPGTLSTFGPLKQIDAGLLSVGYAEAGPANGPPVLLLHGWPYDIYSFVDVAPLLASAGYRVIVPLSTQGGRTRVKSRQTKLEDGRLVSEAFEGEADRDASDQITHQARQRAADQSALFLRSLSWFLPGRGGNHDEPDDDLRRPGLAASSVTGVALRARTSDVFRGAVWAMSRHSCSTSAMGRSPPLVLSGTARSFPSPPARSRGYLGISQRLHKYSGDGDYLSMVTKESAP
jgi:hypothetical protein